MEAKIYNLKAWITSTDANYLRKTLKDMLVDSGFNIEGFTDQSFSPYGYSALWLISESHLAIHTWPEQNKTYVELSSCNKKKQQKFIKKFVELFGDEDSTTAVF